MKNLNVLLAMFLTSTASAEMVCDLKISASGEEVEEQVVLRNQNTSEEGQFVGASVEGKLGIWEVRFSRGPVEIPGSNQSVSDGMTLKLIAPRYPSDRKVLKPEDDLNGERGYFLRLQSRYSTVISLERIYKNSPTTLGCSIRESKDSKR